MVRFALLFSILAICVGSARADFIPGRERAVKKVEMKVAGGTGVYKDIDHLVLEILRKDGDTAISGFALLIDGKRATFSIDSKSNDGCGSIVYMTEARAVADSVWYRMKVTDNSERICENPIAGQWTVEVEYAPLFTQPRDTIAGFGNAEDLALTE